jgi:hypothetical protein
MHTAIRGLAKKKNGIRLRKFYRIATLYRGVEDLKNC